jgi:hypothetical protein
MEVKRLFVSKKNGKGVSERRHLLTKKKKKRKPNSHQPKMFDLKKILRGGLLGMDRQYLSLLRSNTLFQLLICIPTYSLIKQNRSKCALLI